MKIKKDMLENTIKFLNELSLKQKASRMRTKFKNILMIHFQELLQDINEIQKEHWETDEQGNPKKENDRLVFKDLQLFNKDLNELLNEYVIIVEDESNKDMLVSVKYSVLDCDIDFKGQEADYYELICEYFEEIKE